MADENHNVTHELASTDGMDAESRAPALAKPMDSASQWLGGELRHSNPEVCAAYLKQRKKELDDRERGK